MTTTPHRPVNETPAPLDHHPSVTEWFEESRSASPPSWVKNLKARCRYCGGAGLVRSDGRMRVVHAGIWSYNCSARPWWTLGRGHRAKR